MLLRQPHGHTGLAFTWNCSAGAEATLERDNFIQSGPFSSFLWKLNFNEVQLFALPI